MHPWGSAQPKRLKNTDTENTEHSSKRNGKKCTRTYIRKERGDLVVVCGGTRGMKEKKERKKEKDLNRCEETSSFQKGK